MKRKFKTMAMIMSLAILASGIAAWAASGADRGCTKKVDTGTEICSLTNHALGSDLGECDNTGMGCEASDRGASESRTSEKCDTGAKTTVDTTPGGGTGTGYATRESGACAALASEERENGDTGTSAESAESIFDMLYRAAGANLDSIFSALAFLGALALGFLYKKRLLPTLEAALGKLAGGVNTIGEETKKASEASNALLCDAAKKLEEGAAEALLIKGELEKLRGELEAADRGTSEAERFRIILQAQAQLLHDVIMSSSLPQYMKDRAGESFAAMTAKLSAGEEDEAEN